MIKTTSIILLLVTAFSKQQILGAEQFHFGDINKPVPRVDGISHPLHAEKKETRLAPGVHHLQILKVVTKAK